MDQQGEYPQENSHVFIDLHAEEENNNQTHTPLGREVSPHGHTQSWSIAWETLESVFQADHVTLSQEHIRSLQTTVHSRTQGPITWQSCDALAKSHDMSCNSFDCKEKACLPLLLWQPHDTAPERGQVHSRQRHPWTAVWSARPTCPDAHHLQPTAWIPSNTAPREAKKQKGEVEKKRDNCHQSTPWKCFPAKWYPDWQLQKEPSVALWLARERDSSLPCL